jgi:hypothetical protein
MRLKIDYNHIDGSIFCLVGVVKEVMKEARKVENQ